MKRYYKLIISVMIMTIIVTGLISACRPTEKPRVPDNEEMRDMQKEGNVDDDAIIDDEVEDKKDRQLVERSETIADYIVDLPYIDDATAAVKDNIALIGVVVSDETADELTESMRQQIEDEVKRVDKNIQKVYITNESDLFVRIDNIQLGLIRGKPISSYNRQIDEIIRRIEK